LLVIALRPIVVIEVTEVEEEWTRDQAMEEEENEEFAFNGKMVTADTVIDVDSPTKMEEAEAEVDQEVVVIKEADPDLTVEVEAPEGLEDPDPQSNQDLQKNPDLEIEKKEADPKIEVTRGKKMRRKEVEVEDQVTAKMTKKKTGDCAGLFD